jgi:hypothetical protein
MIGDLETGLSRYYKEVQENPNLSSGDQAMYLANLCFVYWIDADLISMLQTSENTLKIAMDHRISEAIAFSLYFNGIACYQQNNLQKAEEAQQENDGICQRYWQSNGASNHSGI